MCQGTQTQIPPTLQYAVECRWFEIQPNGVPFCGCQTWCEWRPNTIYIAQLNDAEYNIVKSKLRYHDEDEVKVPLSELLDWMGGYNNDYICINGRYQICRDAMALEEFTRVLEGRGVFNIVAVVGGGVRYLYGVN